MTITWLPGRFDPVWQVFTIEQTRRSALQKMEGVLLLLVVFLVATPAWLITAALRRRRRDTAALGWMSEHWLHEYRASQSG